MICPNCQGCGYLSYSIPAYIIVTRDMATDACDRSLEGQEIQYGEEEVQEQCQNCNGTGHINEI